MESNLEQRVATANEALSPVGVVMRETLSPVASCVACVCVPASSSVALPYVKKNEEARTPTPDYRNVEVTLHPIVF